MLKPKRKITRQEIKKDPLLEKVGQINSYLHKNLKKLTIYGIAVVLLIVFSFLMFTSSKNKQTAASGSFGIAELKLKNGQVEKGIEELNRIVENFAGSDAAGLSIFLLAKNNLNEKMFDDARANFEIFIKEHKDNKMLLAAAYSGLAVCLEKNKDYAGAASNFEKGGKTSPYAYQQNECFLNSVRNLILINDLGRAEILVNETLDNEPDYKTKSSAESLLAQIEVLKG